MYFIRICSISVIILFHKVMCQNYVINRHFEVVPMNEASMESDFFMDFTCPEDFVLHGKYCFLNRSVSKCPYLETLEVDYKLTIHKENNYAESFAPQLKCAYAFEEFFKLQTHNNVVELRLYLDGTKKPYSLYLDVFLDKPIDNLEERIFCMSKIYRENIRIVPFTEVKYIFTEDATTRRFVLQINQKLTTFYCFCYMPGSVKPTESNLIYANNRKSETFIATVITGRNNPYDIMLAIPPDKYIVTADSPEELKSNTLSWNSTKYCIEVTSTTTKMTWPQTLLGDFSYPKNLCLDDKGQFVKRKCEGDYLTGARWSTSEINCSNADLPLVTKYLMEKQDKDITQAVITEISKTMKDFQKVDIDLMANILQKVKDSKNTVPEETFFSFINKIDQFINLQELSDLLKMKIVGSIEDYIDQLKNGTGSYNNIEYFSAKPFEENLTSYKLNNFQVDLSKKFMKALNLTDEEKREFSINGIVFGIRNLFPKGDQLGSKVVDVKLKGMAQIRKTYKHPIEMFFPREGGQFKCAFWDKKINKWSTFNVETFLHEDTVECRSYHLTKFALLIVPAHIISTRDENILNLLSRIELVFSALGTLVVLFLAAILPKWRRTRLYAVQLSFAILLECCIVLIFDVSGHILDSNYCLYIGATLHFIVLQKFVLMFLIGLNQVQNFVKIYKKTKKVASKLSCNDVLLRWIIPFTITSASAFCYPKKYVIQGTAKFCYPIDEAHTFLVIIPVALLLFFNVISFAIVFINICCSAFENAQNKLFQFKLAVMLWFVLGGTWLAGLLISILPRGIYEDLCYYLFALIAPLQGFVVFIFYVVLDKSNGLTWKSVWSGS